jgi:hypothetical protein
MVRMGKVYVAKPVWGCGGANPGFAKYCLLPCRRTHRHLMNSHAYAEVIQADSCVYEVLLWMRVHVPQGPACPTKTRDRRRISSQQIRTCKLSYVCGGTPHYQIWGIRGKLSLQWILCDVAPCLGINVPYLIDFLLYKYWYLVTSMTIMSQGSSFRQATNTVETDIIPGTELMRESEGIRVTHKSNHNIQWVIWTMVSFD